MKQEVDSLVSHLTVLTDKESCMYDFFFMSFRKTLEELRTIQAILEYAIAKNMEKNGPSSSQAVAPSRQFRSYRANPLESMQNATQRDQDDLGPSSYDAGNSRRCNLLAKSDPTSRQEEERLDLPRKGQECAANSLKKPWMEKYPCEIINHSLRRKVLASCR
jgi:hypothetical protein